MSKTSTAQTYYSVPTQYLNNYYEWITNVTFAGINNTTEAGATSYSNITSTVTPAVVTPGSAYSLIVTIEYDFDESLTIFFD